MWNRTWQTYSSVTQVVYSGARELISKWKKNHIFADNVRVDYFSLLHCSWIWRTKPYCYSLIVWAKSVAPNLAYCKIFENFTGSYLMCRGFWNVKGATKASLLIPWQRSECNRCSYTLNKKFVCAIFTVCHFVNSRSHPCIRCTIYFIHGISS